MMRLCGAYRDGLAEGVCEVLEEHGVQPVAVHGPQEAEEELLAAVAATCGSTQPPPSRQRQVAVLVTLACLLVHVALGVRALTDWLTDP